jgi:hypothetical protein
MANSTIIATPKPNDDPALAMSRIWQSDHDELIRLCAVASRRERVMFDATDADKPAAERSFIEARDARDKQNAPEPNSAEPPWPMLRSCIQDLELLAAPVTEPPG